MGFESHRYSQCGIAAGLELAENCVQTILWQKILGSSIDKKTPKLAFHWQIGFAARVRSCLLDLRLLIYRFPESPGGYAVRPSASFCLLLIACSLLTSQTTFGQVQPAVKDRGAQAPATWDVFLGGGWENSGSQTAYGWDGSVSEFPYRSHRWLGGTVDGSGYYYTKLGIGYQIFPIMAGPSVVATNRHFRPFARIMAGGVLNRVSATRVSLLTIPKRYGETVEVNPKFPSPPTIPGPAEITPHFGFAGGGGIEIPVSSRLAIRGQADWIEYMVDSKGQSQFQNVIRSSAGIVLRY